jgi:hypothetical protein
MVRIALGEAGAALGLFNTMRTHGGATGAAAIESFFPEREQFHSFIVDSHGSLLHGFPDPAGRCIAPSSPSATSSAPRRRSWVTPTASRC